MKNTIKKIAAVAMAFTLIGTGPAITKSVAPESDTTIVAYAKCSHHGQCYSSASNWRTLYSGYDISYSKNTKTYSYYVFESRTVTIHCSSCSATISSRTETRKRVTRTVTVKNY